MIYKLIKRNRVLRTDSHSQFIKWMRKMDLQDWASNDDFMKGYAYRKFIYEQIDIRSESEDVFVEDLQKNNLLKIESPKGLFGWF